MESGITLEEKLAVLKLFDAKENGEISDDSLAYALLALAIRKAHKEEKNED